jgi:hypothetical protein
MPSFAIKHVTGQPTYKIWEEKKEKKKKDDF